MRIPTVKSLREIAGDRAKELRKVLEITKRSDLEAILDKYHATKGWYNGCYHLMPLHIAKLSIADEILGTSGVEYIESDSSKPSFDYCNTGDTYAPTLIRFTTGTYRVGYWGDIVERGGYR